MTGNRLELVELTGPDDPHFLPWLDLYETAFPPNERMLVSYQLNLLTEKAHGGAKRHAILAVADADHALKGLVEYELLPDAGAVYLWYLAIQPSDRGQGSGSDVYRQLLERIDPDTYRILIFEVEKPELAHSEEQRAFAERRIAFYRRLGARLMSGIEYLQYVGSHQPATPMFIMVHPMRPVEPQQAYDLAAAVFADAIRQVGTITLD